MDGVESGIVSFVWGRMAGWLAAAAAPLFCLFLHLSAAGILVIRFYGYYSDFGVIIVIQLVLFYGI